MFADEGAAGSQVDLIEPSLFSSIEMSRAGHRMLLAKALLKLAAEKGLRRGFMAWNCMEFNLLEFRLKTS